MERYSINSFNQRYETHQVCLKNLNKTRTLRVLLPPDYNSAEVGFPVIYMHDGQNLFDHKDAAYGMIWSVPKALSDLYKVTGKSFIVVGIDNAGGFERLDEYSPWVNKTLKEQMPSMGEARDFGGQGAAYGKDLIECILPFINERYKTDVSSDKTAIIGSSMGGLMSLYLGATYPDIFGLIGAFSTAAWFARDQVEACLVTIRRDQRVYLDIGDCESSDEKIKAFPDIYVEGTKALYEVLIHQGMPEKQVKLIIEEGGVHNELAWARRFPKAIEWLYDIREV